MNEITEKIKLLYSYNNKFTLTENKEFINENVGGGLIKLLKTVVKRADGSTFSKPKQWVEDSLKGFKLTNGKVLTANELLGKLVRKELSVDESRNILKRLFSSPDAEEGVKDAIVRIFEGGMIRPTTPFISEKDALNYIKNKFGDNKDLINRIWSKSKDDVTFYKKEIKNVTDVAGQTIKDINPLTPEQISNLEKLYRQKGLKGTFLSSMRNFSKQLNDMMSSETLLMDETLSLIKTLYESKNAANIVDISRRIGDNIKTLTQKSSVNKQIIDKWIDINVLDSTIKNTIKGQDGYKKASKILDNTAFKEWEKKYNKLSKRRSNLRTQLNSLLNPASWFGKNIEKHGSRLGKWEKIIKSPEFAELRRWVISGQTQSLSGIRDYITKFGFPKALANMGKEFVISYIMLSLMMSIVDALSDIIGHYLMYVPYIDEWNWVKEQSLSYDEHFIKGKELDPGSIMQGVKGLIPLLTYLGEELSNSSRYVPGFIDDFLKLIGIITSDKFTDDDLKKVNELKSKGDSELNKMNSQIKQQQGDSTKPQTGGYTNDPSGFKEYIKKRFKDNNPVISGTKDVFTYEDVEFNYNNGKFE